ncbi:hypothetical protein V8B55DRAFT_1514501 [Mucor lusitanicus]|uniref:Invertebrate defensins family profile domain-containing protein n=1 Tax=Mucor circinelloides f. lusitanicus TaxID=29924 RepID=A0A8H4B8F9_MUCCL|nr:hypothetical protein FB192DRAFT_1400879 [Mucor lusitanicus]
MKLIPQLSTLAAIALLLSMVSAAPSSSGHKTCHTLSEAHANAVCKEYCGSTGYILGECGSEGICICSNKTATVQIHHTTLHSSVAVTTTASSSKVSTASRLSTIKDATRSKPHPSASNKHSKPASTISHTRTHSKRHRSTKTTTTYKTVQTTVTKVITMKASRASALADNHASNANVTTVYTTVSRHNKKRPTTIRTITARSI